MKHFTVEETNLLSIYADSSKPALLKNIRAALKRREFEEYIRRELII